MTSTASYRTIAAGFDVPNAGFAQVRKSKFPSLALICGVTPQALTGYAECQMLKYSEAEVSKT
jgi:hypothetical protein